MGSRCGGLGSSQPVPGAWVVSLILSTVPGREKAPPAGAEGARFPHVGRSQIAGGWDSGRSPSRRLEKPLTIQRPACSTT